MSERATLADLAGFSNPLELPVEFRENEFSGKVLLITGASRGIGAATARRFAQLGAFGIVINSRVDSREAAESLIDELQDMGKAAGTRALWIPGDIATPDTVKLLVAGTVGKFGRLDVLVSNAGMRSKKEKLTIRTSEEEIREIMEANFFGNVRIIKAAATQMIRQRPQGGEIIVTSSLAAEGNPGQPGYAASKGAINSYVKTLASECQVFGIPIRINAVAPGLVETDLTKDLSDQQRNALLAATHSERALKPEEVAEQIVYLASDFASNRNGQIIPVVGF
jgi:3-oxoacyl-[acyl-carrier protein] reductase